MYSNELKLFQRNNEEAIWTDDHISKAMLKAHLDESNDAASRMPHRRAEIINWINSKISSNSSIIDLGCGPGFYTYEFGKLGHNILGIDINKESLNFANQNNSINGKVNYQFCNYLNDPIEGKYNLAINIFCHFATFPPNEQKIILNKIYNILDDKGLYIFDVFGKEEVEKQKEYRKWYVSQGNDFWSKDPYIMMEEKKIFDNVIGERYFLYDINSKNIKEIIMWNQYYDKESISRLLQENGFEPIEINTELMNYREETLFVIAKKKKI